MLIPNILEIGSKRFPKKLRIKQKKKVKKPKKLKICIVFNP